jgi:hypothetical protein
VEGYLLGRGAVIPEEVVAREMEKVRAGNETASSLGL